MSENILQFDAIARKRLQLEFSVSIGTHPSRVENVKWPWLKLVERLMKSTADKRTLEEFCAMHPDRQLSAKNNGYFVGAPFKTGRRRNSAIGLRSVLTVDIDKCEVDLLRRLLAGTSGLGQAEYVVYSTRKHSIENPRIRIVIPLAVPCEPDQFVPIMRHLAYMIDPNMETVDPVSYKIAQFMYWPSHCADQTPIFHHNVGAILNVTRTLKACGWDGDYAKLPRSAREQGVREGGGTKGDPREKKNFVGAFCRAYDCHDVIREFLDDIYTPSEKAQDGTVTRYSYTPGTTANGLVVYEGGLFVSSFQGSDPVGAEANPNAFDFARIHLFGHLDEDIDPTLPPDARPSFLAMKNRFSKDKLVKPEMLASWGYPISDDAFDDIPLTDEQEAAFLDPTSDGPIERQPAPRKNRDSKGWRDRLALTDDGLVKATLPNLQLILEFFPTFKGRFAHDEFINDVVQIKPLRSDSLNINLPGRSRMDPFGRVGQDAIDAVRAILWSPRGEGLPGWELRFANEDIEQAIRLVSKANRVHPVREWLQSLEGTWDGKARVEKLFIKGCHTADTPYYRNTARVTLVAAVARIMEPGCKFDDACILEGAQGTRKSSFVKALGGMWAGETEGHFADEKKFVESTLGFWIIEIPELVQFGKTEIQSIKACMSRQREHVRLSYKKFAETYMRQSIFIGTTNEDKYLRDSTGGRRFLPIAIGPGQCNVEWVLRHRPQIFAEAMTMYRAMRAAQPHGDLPLYQVDDKQAKIEQEARVVEDGTEELRGAILAYIEAKVPQGQENSGDPPADSFDEDGPLVPRMSFCSREIMDRVMGLKPADWSKYTRMVNKAIRSIPGWDYLDKRDCGSWGEQRAYRRRFSRPASSEDDL